MTQDYGNKIRAIRMAEGITQTAMAKECGIALSRLRNIESGGDGVGLKTIERIVSTARLEKYTLWMMIGKTTEAAGQISPALSHSGPEKTE
ncbi:helix-turn-helix transcriptional regulator [Candidatus Pantoea floridensis]|uniref:Helix-turn-helix n=1 Tax=Candidatus Pantoea floridensis TaxID=1938870 RepID=A0A286BTW3_9GAMM|nr:helix-turn-helix transcriptional regulator [Pantoea floridensis]PIF24124.1 helix-turn-helix protein [Enterobacteriaceae bacterium JKS000233]SOD37577.1 Helix-turn-helix [Pantoea floridensis]